MDDLDIAIDLTTVQRFAQEGADAVVAALTALRQRHDLSGVEYTRRVRVAPWEIPHSHPVLTLNARSARPEDVLSTYVHEQMHWYTVWFAARRPEDWSALIAALDARYPDARTRPLEGARDGYSTVLHLIVNWLEIDALAGLIGRAAAEDAARRQPVYGWVYATVLADWAQLSTLYVSRGLAPRVLANQFNDEDRAVAAAATD